MASKPNKKSGNSSRGNGAAGKPQSGPPAKPQMPVQAPRAQNGAPVNVKPSAPVNTSEEEDTSKKSSALKALIGSIAAKLTSVFHKRNGKIRENKMLDAEEYKRRISILDAKHRNARDMEKVALSGLPDDLLKTFDDKQAPQKYKDALFACLQKCKAAETAYNKTNSLYTFRETTLHTLDEFRRELMSLRDNPPAQTNTPDSQGTIASGTGNNQKEFLKTEFEAKEQSQSDSAPPIADGEQPTSQQTTAQAAETAERQAPEPEDWKGKYEETKTVLERTQKLLAETKDDFTRQLQNLERTLADEQMAVQDEKEATANTVKEDLGRKQWRITELEKEKGEQQARISLLEGEKVKLEADLADLNKRMAEVEEAVKMANSKREELQNELDEQRTPAKARTALETALEKERDALPDSLAEFVTGLLEVTSHAESGHVDWLEDNHNALLRFVYTPPEAVSLLADQQFTNIPRLYQVLTVQNHAHELLKANDIEPIHPTANETFTPDLHEHTDRDIVWNNTSPDLDNKIKAVLRVGFRNVRSGRVLSKAWVKRYVYRGSTAAGASGSVRYSSAGIPGASAKSQSVSAMAEVKTEPETVNAAPAPVLQPSPTRSTLPAEQTTSKTAPVQEQGNAAQALSYEQTSSASASSPEPTAVGDSPETPTAPGLEAPGTNPMHSLIADYAERVGWGGTSPDSDQEIRDPGKPPKSILPTVFDPNKVYTLEEAAGVDND